MALTATDLLRDNSSDTSDDRIVFTPADRFALFGKTRSGKSYAETLLVCTIIPFVYPSKSKKPWQIWFADTKGDPRDLKRLREWGFLPAHKAPPNYPRLIFSVRPLDPDDEKSVAKQVQRLCMRAMARGKVHVVIDEYVSCVMSKMSTGAGLKDVYQRGGGKSVGSTGGSQEPVNIPRQLASQATHLFLFRVTFNHDVEWCYELCPEYGRARDPNPGPVDKHGFFYRWLDGPMGASRWRYYSDIHKFLLQRKAIAA